MLGEIIGAYCMVPFSLKFLPSKEPFVDSHVLSLEAGKIISIGP